MSLHGSREYSEAKAFAKEGTWSGKQMLKLTFHGGQLPKLSFAIHGLVKIQVQKTNARDHSRVAVSEEITHLLSPPDRADTPKVYKLSVKRELEINPSCEPGLQRIFLLLYPGTE